MITIYVAGPYSADDTWKREMHIRKAESVALCLLQTGKAAVICPHTMSRFYHGAIAEHTVMQACLELIKRSDVVLVLPNWLNSRGTRQEIKAAKDYGILVKYLIKYPNLSTLSEIVDAINKETTGEV